MASTTQANTSGKNIFAFRLPYFLLTILLLIVEILIAVFVHDQIVRPYIGDVLVVMLLYCFIRALFKVSVNKAALIVFIFSFFVEMLQYFNIIKALGLQHLKLATIIVGNSFDWTDLLMYTIGIAIVFLIETFR